MHVLFSLKQKALSPDEAHSVAFEYCSLIAHFALWSIPHTLHLQLAFDQHILTTVEILTHSKALLLTVGGGEIAQRRCVFCELPSVPVRSEHRTAGGKSRLRDARAYTFTAGRTEYIS